MKVKGTPNMLVRHNRQRRIKGVRRGGVWFRFDSNGFAELDDAKLHPRQIKALKTHFEIVDDIRQKAKEAGIKKWHVKSIKRLKEELEG